MFKREKRCIKKKRKFIIVDFDDYFLSCALFHIPIFPGPFFFPLVSFYKAKGGVTFYTLKQ